MDQSFLTLRRNEFGRLDESGQIYLDYTGSALYPASLVRAHADLLCSRVLGNPHSRSPSSRDATERVEAARARILSFFRADPEEWEAIFTLNASNALKLVGEAYPFAPGCTFRLTADNHNSVNGLREYAAGHGADVRYLRLGADLHIVDIEEQLAGADPGFANLFAYPAQSNFSGVKHPLDWIETTQSLGYHVLLDAAAFVPSSRLDLSSVRPDFAAVSFYKMFGFPTGVGVLLARRDSLARLHRPWFGGGTVRFVSAQNQVRILYRNAAAFEDGTLNFLDIAAIPAGLDFIDALGVEHINEHVTELTTVLLRGLLELRHSDGSPLIRVYGPLSTENRGGTVAFNLITQEGRVIDCRRVEQAAADAGISLRTGYFCNPGAAEHSFELPHDEAKRCFQELNGDSFTLQQFSACLHDKPVGAIRVSVGLCNVSADLDGLFALLGTFCEGVPTGSGVGQAVRQE